MTSTTLGPYTLISRIAKGGMATVYLAQHQQTHEQVALKVLSLEASEDAEFVARFRREGQVVATLNHLNIVPVYDAGCDQGQFYIAMAYLPYGTLKDRLTKYEVTDEHMPIEEALDIGRQIAWALDHAHKKGLIHRDVKPSNILLALGGRYVLSDFGVAYVRDSTRLTRTDKYVVGTPAYMSPEQAEQRPFDHRIDVYALGIVLYEMLTGRTPYVSEFEMMILYGHVHGEPPSVRRLRPDLTPSVIQVVERTMAKSPDARFQSAGEMALAIEALIQPGSTASVDRPNHRRPIVIASVMGILALVFFIGIVVIAVGPAGAQPHQHESNLQLAEVRFVSQPDNLAIRSQASRKASIITHIAAQTAYTVIAKTPDQRWLLIALDTHVGWVYVGDGQVIGSLKAVPNVALPLQTDWEE